MVLWELGLALVSVNYEACQRKMSLKLSVIARHLELQPLNKGRDILLKFSFGTQ